MPVRIFFPRIPNDQEDFLKFVSGWCSTHNVKIAKNKDGSPFCILPVNYLDSKGKSANDIIDALTGKVVGDVTLKPRLYVDHGLRINNNEIRVPKEDIDDVVNITHYSRDFYYVQLLSESDKNKLIGEYLKTLYEECRSNMLTVLDYDELSIGRLYASMYRNESHFFRIKLIDKLDTDEIKVLFVDFGNIEYLRDTPVLEITEEIASLPALAHKCSIDNICISDPKKHDALSREVLNRTYKAKIFRKKDDGGTECMSVDFLDFASVSYRNFLIFEGVATDNDSTEPIQSPVHNHCPKVLDTDKNADVSNTTSVVVEPVKSQENGVNEKRAEVVITHMESFKEFYVQKVNKYVEADMVNITTKIESLITDLSSEDSMQFVSDDIVYLSKFSDDGNWYRCKVIDNKFDNKDPYCNVQFIDFGNKEKKYNAKDLKPLTSEWNEVAAQLAAITPCAIKCSFSNTLATTLTANKIGRKHFRIEYIRTEKVIELVFSVASETENVWTVLNVFVEGEEDFETRFNLTKKEVASPDYYRLSNIESVSRMWFQLVSSTNKDRARDLNNIRKWSVGRMPANVQTVTSVRLGILYCAVNKHSQLFRCRVIGRNVEHAMVQFIDTGIYDIVRITLLYPLPSHIESIPAISQAYHLSMPFIDEKTTEIEKIVVQILDQTDVTFDLGPDNALRDVFIKERSLRAMLIDQGLVDGSERGYGGLPDCLLPPVTEEGDVDFSLPSVDQMNEVPLQVAIENSRVQLLRKMFAASDASDGECVLSGVWRLVDRCEHLDAVIACCEQVDEIDAGVASLQTEFSESLMDRKAKMRDLQPVIDRRTSVCTTICDTYAVFRERFDEVTSEAMQQLSGDVTRWLRGVTNLMAIFGCDGRTDCGADMRTMRDAVTAFQLTEQYRDIVARLRDKAAVTDAAKDGLQRQITAMSREYDLDDPLTDEMGQSVSLVDSTFELHSALLTEKRHWLDVLVGDEALKARFDVCRVLASAHGFLARQKDALVTIGAMDARLRALNEYAVDVLADDSAVITRIEDSHRKILSGRSALRHAVPDLEDAEELDLKDRQHELQAKIRDVRHSLHGELRASKELLECPDIHKLMLKKPELQLKNQSLLLREDCVPVFLWDAIYFDLSQDSSNEEDGCVVSLFEDRRVKVKKLLMTNEDYRAVLGNVAVYSGLTATPTAATEEHQSQISSVNIEYAFVTKCGSLLLYLIMADYQWINDVTQLPISVTRSLLDLVFFVRSLINAIVNLWHSGFIYGHEDIRHGLLVRLTDDVTDDVTVSLPLPVSSIMHREQLTRQSVTLDSINVYLRHLSALFDQCLKKCDLAMLNEDESETVAYLVTVIGNCCDVAVAETVCEELSLLGTKLERLQSEETVAVVIEAVDGGVGGAMETGGDDSGRDSSIEQVLTIDEAGVDGDGRCDEEEEDDVE